MAVSKTEDLGSNPSRITINEAGGWLGSSNPLKSGGATLIRCEKSDCSVKEKVDDVPLGINSVIVVVKSQYLGKTGGYQRVDSLIVSRLWCNNTLLHY
jgi:hypothetical protein